MDVLPDVLAVLGGLATAAAGAAGIRRLASWVRRLGHFLDDWFGEDPRPGIPARPGVMTRLATIEDRLGVVEHEVTYNDGTSLKDAVGLLADSAGVALPTTAGHHPEQ
ncbi:MAG: hypothetical protein L0Y54_10020 [Sporichthyaceae bacterium]|nr:hypothetical protein [Sporichthyaceae bacterium]